MKFVIKLGGSLLESVPAPLDFLKSVVELAQCGHPVLLAHGGGKLLSQYLQRLGIESRFAQGLRVTDAAAMEVALMVLAGLVNKQVVMAVQRHGGRAVGLCGGDARCVRAKKLEPRRADGAPEDLGLVGEVTDIDPAIFDCLFDDRVIPVVASIAAAADHTYLNVNADQVASALASGLVADRLVYLTDVPGVLDRSGRLIERLSLAQADALVAEGAVSGGMLPKLRACRAALTKGVPYVCITQPQALNLAGGVGGKEPIKGTWIYA